MAETAHLPDVNRIGLNAPFEWLAKGWRDYWRAAVPCLVYGAVLAAISMGIAYALFTTGTFMWIFVLIGGFLLVAPMLAMGAYQAGRMLEAGQSPSVSDMLFVPSAFRRDLIFLGGMLFVLYGLWVQAAYITYGLSTRTMHDSVVEFLRFLLLTPEGHQMVLLGSGVGGVFAFFAFCIVVISAPMLLNEKTDFFIALITSWRSVFRNLAPMLLWAALIVALTALGVATAFVGLIIVFPWIGIASWHAYRTLTRTV